MLRQFPQYIRRCKLAQAKLHHQALSLLSAPEQIKPD